MAFTWKCPENAQEKSHEHLFENRIYKMKASSTRRQWVNWHQEVQINSFSPDDDPGCH